MTDYRPFSTGEHRGHPAALDGDSSVPHCIDTAMKAM
jgi:hypothetical protein